MIQVRLARYDELATMLEVAMLSFEETFAPHNTREDMDIFYHDNYTLEKMQQEFRQPNTALFLALDEGSVLGFVRLRKNDEVKEKLGDSTLELQRLYIHPQHQGKRIGSLLMEKALEYAKGLKVDWMWLGVWERNFNAQKFYAKWRFERFGEHTFLHGTDPQIDWLLKRKV
ncbi:MAG: GNAT family N-acetyltransferase [Cytophagales bacterium]